MDYKAYYATDRITNYNTINLSLCALNYLFGLLHCRRAIITRYLLHLMGLGFDEIIKCISFLCNFTAFFFVHTKARDFFSTREIPISKAPCISMRNNQKTNTYMVYLLYSRNIGHLKYSTYIIRSCISQITIEKYRQYHEFLQ